jgi:hypothetical protein
MAKNCTTKRQLTMDEMCQSLGANFGEDKEWTVNGDHDIRVASWHIADLLLGPDDGSMDRDDVECQIQQIIAVSFSDTAGKVPVFGPVDPDNLPPGYKPARPRRH